VQWSVTWPGPWDGAKALEQVETKVKHISFSHLVSDQSAECIVLVATKKLRFVEVKVFSKLQYEKNDTEEQVIQKRKWYIRKNGSLPEFSALSIIFITG
jgi:hypothetical protein